MRFTLLCFGFLFLACKGEVPERTDYKTFKGITYGEISRVGSQLVISIKNIGALNSDQVLKFAYCLASDEIAQGRPTSYIRIYNRFHQPDQLPKDLKELYQVQFEERPAQGEQPAGLFIVNAKRGDAGNKDRLYIEEQYKCQ